MQAPQDRRCGDCKLFGTLASQPNACGWQIRECTGAKGTFAKECSLFTYQNGYQPLLDCPEDDLPEATAEQMSLFK